MRRKVPRVLLWVAFGVIVALALSLGAFAIAGGSLGEPVGVVQVTQPEGRPSPDPTPDLKPDRSPTAQPTKTTSSSPTEEQHSTSTSSGSPHETEGRNDHDSDDD